MAIKTSLRAITKRIAEAVKRATVSHGLLPNDFALVGSFDEESERISLVFATNRSVDKLQLYKDILREIRSAFPEIPSFTMHVGLVIRRVQNPDEVYWDSGIGEEEIDLTEMIDRYL